VVAICNHVLIIEQTYSRGHNRYGREKEDHAKPQGNGEGEPQVESNHGQTSPNVVMLKEQNREQS
jgi:hypothetical protein